MKTRDCDTFCCSSVCSVNWALCLVKLGVSNSRFRLYSSCTDTMILEETPISLVSLMFWLDFLFKLPQLKASSHKNSRFISIQYFTLDNCWTPFSTPYWNTGSPGLTSFPPISIWGSLGRQTEVKGKADPHGQWKSRKPVPSDCCKRCFASHVLPEAVLALCTQPPVIKDSKTQQWTVGDRGPVNSRVSTIYLMLTGCLVWQKLTSEGHFWETRQRLVLWVFQKVRRPSLHPEAEKYLDFSCLIRFFL